MTLKDIKLNDLGFKLFLAFIAICPVFYDTMNQGRFSLRLAEEQFYQLGATVLFAVVFLENIYLSMFLLWSIFIYCYYGFPPIGGNYVMNIFFSCIIYQMAYKLINEDNVKTVFKCVLWIGAVNIVFIILQRFGMDFIYLTKVDKFYNTDFVGIFGQKAFMGMFMAVCAAVAAPISLWFSALFLIPAYFSECSVAILAIVGVILFNAYFKSGKLFISLLVVLGLLSFGYVAHDYVPQQGQMFKDRASLWKVSLRDAAKHPIMGWGLDSYRNVGSFKNFIYFKNNRTQESRAISYEALKIHQETGNLPPMGDFIKEGDSINPWDHPHNEFISLLYEFGLVGVLIIGLLFYDIKRRFIISRDILVCAGVFIVFIITSLSQFPLHLSKFAIFGMVFLGAYYKLTDMFKNQIEGVPNGT